MRDENFIGGEFLDETNCIVPQDEKFLLKYFKTDIQKAFLRYSFVSLEWHDFVNQTGFFCRKRMFLLMKVKLKKIMEAYKKANNDFDLETIDKIKRGKFLRE